MTFACSRRSLAALVLAASLVLPVSASAASPRPSPGPGGGHHTPTAGSRQRPSISRHQVSGILTGITGSNGTTVPTLPAALTVKAGSTAIIVTVPATTTVVRGYGGPSSLDEFAEGDRIVAQGAFQTSTAFIARRIMDLSVQARSRVVGNILSVQTGQTNSLTLQAARRGNQSSQPMTVTLTSSTLLVSGTVTVTVSALQPGMRVLAMGTYNRTQSTMRASRVRVLSARSARSAHRRQRP